jgi:hypothetical protein
MSVDADLYVSCLVRRSGGNESFALTLTDGVAVGAQFGWEADAHWFAGGPQRTSGPVRMPRDATFFVVLRIRARASADDQAFLKAYAEGDTVHATDAGLSGAGPGRDEWTAISAPFSSGTVLGGILLDSGGARGTCEVDEIRVGASWQTVTGQTSKVRRVGAGCAGSAGVPDLGASRTPFIGNRAFALEVASIPASAPVSLLAALATSPAPRTLPNGCPLHLPPSPPPFAAAGTRASVSGTAWLPLPIPEDLRLQGARLGLQGAVLDGSAAGGYTVTNGLELML